MITVGKEAYERALRCAEADLETALIAVTRAVDSAGRKVCLLPSRDYTAGDLRTAIYNYLSLNECKSGEVEERLAVNVTLLVRAWRAALHYEALKSRGIHDRV